MIGLVIRFTGLRECLLIADKLLEGDDDVEYKKIDESD